MKKKFDEFYDETEKVFGEKYQFDYEEALDNNKKFKFVAFEILLIFDVLFVVKFRNIILNDRAIILASILILTVMFYLGIAWLLNRRLKKFSAAFKEVFVERMINNFCDDVKYDLENGISKELYERVFKDYSDKYFTEDYFEARVDDKYYIRAAEVHTLDSSTRGEHGEDMKTIFWGLFVEVKLDKNINADFCVSSSGIKTPLNRAIINSPDLEKIYKVYSDDNIRTVDVLNSDIKKKFIDLYRQFYFMYDVHIINNSAYIRINTKKLFEIRLLKKMLDRDVLRRDFENFKKMYDMICELIKIIDCMK